MITLSDTVMCSSIEIIDPSIQVNKVNKSANDDSFNDIMENIDDLLEYSNEVIVSLQHSFIEWRDIAFDYSMELSNREFINMINSIDFLLDNSTNNIES